MAVLILTRRVSLDRVVDMATETFGAVPPMNTCLIQQSVPAHGPNLALAGIGLRPQHHAWVLRERPKAAWFEVHAESFMTRGLLLDELDSIAADYPLSVHAAGLSLGSVTLPERRHLDQLCDLVTRFEPDLVSDHLAWSFSHGVHLPDLLPLPYTEEALRVVIRNVHHVQDSLQRQILLENPSRYFDGADSMLTEAEFLSEVVLRTGCGVLLDINNVFVSSVNRGVDPGAVLAHFLSTLPPESFGEIHLAGHSCVEIDSGGSLCLDDHGSRVGAEVWALYEAAVSSLGCLPTLIEWDTRLPAFEALQDQASLAQSIMSDTAGWGGARAAAR